MPVARSQTLLKRSDSPWCGGTADLGKCPTRAAEEYPKYRTAKRGKPWFRATVGTLLLRTLENQTVRKIDITKTEFVVGKTKWIEAYNAQLEAADEDGNDIFVSEGPFRTRERALLWAKRVHRGIACTTTITLVPEGERFKSVPRAKKRKRKNS